jgi:hypothetical protein
MIDAQGHDESRRRGLEMQAALPEPSPRALEWERRRRRRDKSGDAAWALADLSGYGWGALVAVPGLLIWLYRRLRRFTDSLGDGPPA